MPRVTLKHRVRERLEAGEVSPRRILDHLLVDWPAFAPRPDIRLIRRYCREFFRRGRDRSIVASGVTLSRAGKNRVLIHFIDDNSKVVSSQVVTREVVHRLPLLAALLDVATKEGQAVVKELMEKLNGK